MVRERHPYVQEHERQVGPDVVIGGSAVDYQSRRADDEAGGEEEAQGVVIDLEAGTHISLARLFVGWASERNERRLRTKRKGDLNFMMVYSLQAHLRQSAKF